ncbi:DUF4148 domain-containing protein [Herbaspirillum seropedicae]|uniref:DUF4148 domain-containing protein n=1 Tax=Herbaspirillum seropedicae TaxID=964 RepID=UPI003D98DC4E
MKTSHLILAGLVSVCSMSAFAQSTVSTDAARDKANLTADSNYPVVTFKSSKTRADVMAELQAARDGVPMPAQAAKPSMEGSTTQGQAADASLYNGA